MLTRKKGKIIMIKCKIFTSTNSDWVEQLIEEYYKQYEVIDIKFSTTDAAGTTFDRRDVKYSIIVIYKRR